MAEYTLTYSESVQGFPSFYSYIPDMMIGMNNYFYSFKNGNLWRHNTNANRNSYYGLAAESSPSSITSVFNESPLENKIFKTINLESDDAWSVTLNTDLQTNGYIDPQWFEKKEAAWFAFVRATNTTPAPDAEYLLRSVGGIADCTAVSGSGGPSAIVDFALTVPIGSIVSVGDYFYFGVSPTYAPQWGGTIREVNIDLKNNINNIKVDNAPIVGVNPLPAAPFYCMYVKNSIAESHGMLGHYCEFTLTNDSVTATELFAVESQVMKSFP